MRIALCQSHVSFGDVEANLGRIEAALEKAQAESADVLCMPETFLQGYFQSREEAWENSVALDSSAFAGILERTARFEPMLLFGLNERRGDKLYNTVVVVERGRPVGSYSKANLVYDYFEPGAEFPVFEKAGVKFGVIICKDSSYLEPSLIAAMRAAQVIFSPHFNHIAYDAVEDHTRRVRAHHVARATETQCFVCKTNVVVTESEGTAAFGRAGVGVGDSFIVSPDGRFVVEAGRLVEALLVYDIAPEALPEERRWDEPNPAAARALAREYLRRVEA